jgi:hypothetical protein
MRPEGIFSFDFRPGLCIYYCRSRRQDDTAPCEGGEGCKNAAYRGVPAGVVTFVSNL